MGCTDGNVYRLAGANDDLLIVECHFRCAFDDEPVLCSLGMFLVAESLAGQDLYPLHFETAIFFEHGISSPRPAIKLPHTFLLDFEWWNITEPSAVAPDQIFPSYLVGRLDPALPHSVRFAVAVWF